MVKEPASQHDDELEDLRPLVEAVSAEVPSDPQWEAARQRLLATLRPTPPAHARSRETHLRASGLRWFAIAATVLAVLTLLVVHQGTRRSLPAVATGVAIGQIEQAHAASVRHGGEGEPRPLAADEALHAGDQLNVEPQGSLHVRLSDGSRLWLAGGTEAVCVGPRSNDSPAWRLLRGEIQAEVTASPDTKFCMAAPGAALRVLGTEFHVRVYPQTKKEDQVMRNAAVLPPSLVLLTVLSGSVAVGAGGEEKVVPEGNRAMVDASKSSVITEEVGQLDYLRKWVAQRMNASTRPARAEVLRFVKRHSGLLHSLVAIDAETGKTRHVADFVGYPEIVQTFGPRLALVEAVSICYSTDEPVSIGGSSIVVPYPRLMVDLEDGSKAAFPPLVGYRGGASELSPDRRKLAFWGPRISADIDIEFDGLKMLDLETLKTTKLLPADWDTGLTSPHWSPDSRWVAISKGPVDSSLQYKILLIDTLNGTVQPTDLEGMHAHFTPDGKRLVYYAGYRDTGDGYDTPGGELRVVTLPDGKPEPLLRLSADADIGGLAFSPDGAFLALCEAPVSEAASKTPARIHLIDLATKKDEVIPLPVKGGLVNRDFRWLDDGATFLFSYSDQTIAGDDVSYSHWAKLLKRDGNQWKATQRRLDLPTLEETEGLKRFAGRLEEVFAAYHHALGAQYMHRIEESRREYLLARDRMAAIMRDLEQAKGEGVEAVKLEPSDLRLYAQRMDEEAALSPAGLSAQAVRGSLKWHIPAMLSTYWHKYGQFPPSKEPTSRQTPPSPESPPPFAQWAKQVGNEEWAFGYVPGNDQGGMRRRLFLVPGEAPEKKATSFEVVRSDDNILVLRTPVLATGKRFEATYRVKKKGFHEDQQGKRTPWVWIGTEVVETD
jgi:ferric-dicitrate binding protein FerR (iron transport regulator)